MTPMTKDTLSLTFSALADPTRRQILARLANGELSVTQLAEPFKMTMPAVSKHLRVLENAGLMMRRKEGRIHHCRLAVGPLQGAAEWLEFYRGFWETRFESLADYLENLDQEDEQIDDHPDN